MVVRNHGESFLLYQVTVIVEVVMSSKTCKGPRSVVR